MSGWTEIFHDLLTINGLVTLPPLIWDAQPIGSDPIRTTDDQLGVTLRTAFPGDASRLYSVAGSLFRLLSVMAFVMACAGGAEANSKYAGIVVDAKTGRTLYASDAESIRYPASLTKMMTLYIIFESLQSGRITKSTRIPVSAYAAARPPSKLGLKPGQTISVEDAIYALVTKSANDVASAVGEYFGGSESGFGQIMTRKAHQLGMSRTTFRNPHGLPDSRQVTTAHDMARLGIALREHFPEYYDYFSAHSFSYGGRRYSNHNRLLGKVRGVDGIKTGYTRASGFNLVSSVSSGNRQIVAVVMGGRTGNSRNAQMVKLINAYLPKASRGKKQMLIARGKPAAVVASATVLPKTAPLPAEKPSVLAMAPEKVTEQPGVAVDPVQTAAIEPVSGWMVQVASSPSRSDAEDFLAAVRSKAGDVLGNARPITTTYDKDGTTYYRARFAGFAGKSAAWDTCNALKRKKIECYAVEQ